MNNGIKIVTKKFKFLIQQTGIKTVELGKRCTQ